jgi:hypothetical protein
MALHFIMNSTDLQVGGSNEGVQVSNEVLGGCLHTQHTEVPQQPRVDAANGPGGLASTGGRPYDWHITTIGLSGRNDLQHPGRVRGAGWVVGKGVHRAEKQGTWVKSKTPGAQRGA